MMSCLCLVRRKPSVLWILIIVLLCVYPLLITYGVSPSTFNHLSKDQVSPGTKFEKQISPGPTCPRPLQKVFNISCVQLFTGDPDYTQTLDSNSFHRRRDDCYLLSLVENCTNVVHHHGYSGKIVTEEEIDFPLAFGIKIHKDPTQAEQLLRTIYRPHNVYCIHVDLKADKSVSDPVRKLAKCFDNVFVIQEYRVIYSSIRQPLSDIACMKKVTNSNVKWKYYLILAGQEFVLKTNLEIVQILKQMKGRNDIEVFPVPKREMKRYIFKHPITNDKFQTKIKKNEAKPPFKHNITIYKGSSYAMMSREFVKYVLTSNISRDLFQWAADVYAPEEMIWATLNALPGAPGGYGVHVKEIDGQFLSRATIWQQYKKPCYGKYVRWICVFSYKDLPWLVSAPEVVANKFHSDFDQLVLDCLEEWLHNKTMLGKTVNMNWYHYRNVPHVKI